MDDHRLTRRDREVMAAWADKAYAMALAMLRERTRLNDELHKLNVEALEAKVAEVDAANKKPATV